MINADSLKAAARVLLPSTPEKAVFAGASALLVVAGVRRSRPIEQAVKPLIMASIGIALWRSREQRPALDNALLGTAVVASMIGDQLMLEEEFAREQDEADVWIKRGAAAFSVNHFATIGLALRHGARPGLTQAAPRAVSVMAGWGLLATRRPKMLAPLGAYSKLLATMSTVMASPQLVAGGDNVDARRALDVGGALFLSSDATILNRQVFLGRDSGAGAVAEGWVLASYCAAQAMIFAGLAELSAAHRTSG